MQLLRRQFRHAFLHHLHSEGVLTGKFNILVLADRLGWTPLIRHCGLDKRGVRYGFPSVERQHLEEEEGDGKDRGRHRREVGKEQTTTEVDILKE